jgi:exoribonuclease R
MTECNIIPGQQSIDMTSEGVLKNRLDCRKMIICSVDPETARDLDDALSIELISKEDNPELYSSSQKDV